MSKYILPWEQGLVKQVIDILICTVLECTPIKEDNKEEEKENERK